MNHKNWTAAAATKSINFVTRLSAQVKWPRETLPLLRSESPSGMCAKLRTVAASNNRDRAPQSLNYCLFAPHTYIVVLSAHPVCGESHIQRNASGEVAATSPPFFNERHRSRVLCVKAELGTAFTSWWQHHFVSIGKPERHVRKASHCGSKQQYRSCTTITLLLLVHATFIYVCYCSRTSRSWLIAHSTQHHRRGCNTTDQNFLLWLIGRSSRTQYESSESLERRSLSEESVAYIPAFSIIVRGWGPVALNLVGYLVGALKLVFAFNTDILHNLLQSVWCFVLLQEDWWHVATT